MLISTLEIRILSFLVQTPDVSKIIQGIKDALKLIFGDQIPGWILPIVGSILLLALLLAALVGSLSAFVKIKEIFVNSILPSFYNKERERRSKRRRKFADQIESELRRLNNLEAWNEYRFTELEAEVDAEGRRRLFGILPSIYRSGSSLRRERSLSRALKLSDERLVIVEGEPGSGKSVALRHVASLLAVRAMKSRSTKSLIPIYVNLKEIERKKGEVVDRNLIESFVLKVLNRVNDRYIEEFLDEEFNEGLQNGSWFFLFDSFDEIPEVLSSTEADKVISEYGTAISDFLHGLNECRGVIASRFFHGPKQFGWPRFRILPLTAERRLELIKRADLKIDAEGQLIGQLDMAAQEISSMASNPMFLGLLCEHMRSGYPFPENSHTVLETYIESRLSRDKDRLYKRFKLKPEELRTTAEAAAFCMAADAGLGLSPNRVDIKAAGKKLDIKLGQHFDKTLDALTYLKLARAETSTTTSKSEQFTFSHRRFQEYFATAVVLREPHRITAPELLLDARWRETAVVMCQTQTPETVSALISEAERLVAGFAETLRLQQTEHAVEEETSAEDGDSEKPKIKKRFVWPRHALHVLGLLQDGFMRRLNVLSDQMRQDIGEVVTISITRGISADTKWALDISGTAPPSVLTQLLRKAFNSHSQVLRDSAYRQVAKLNAIPADLALGIRMTLGRMAILNRVRKERTATFAHLSRLNQSSNYLAALRVLLWLPLIDLFLHLLLLMLVFVNLGLVLWRIGSQHDQLHVLFLCLIILLVPLSYLSFYWTGARFAIFMRLRGKLTQKATNLGREAGNHAFITLTVSRTWVAGVGMILPLFFISELSNILSVRDLMRSYSRTGAIWLYVAIWAPSALSFAVEGRFLNPLLWPVFPVLALGRLGRTAFGSLSFRGLFKGFFDEFFGRLKSAFIEAMLMTGLIVGVVGTIIAAIYGISVIPYGEESVIGIVIVATVTFTGILLGLWVNDLAKWRRWRKSRSEILTAPQFIEHVRLYNYQRSKMRFINFVRVKGLIPVSPESEEAIYNFARELETPGPRRPQPFLIRRLQGVVGEQFESHEKNHDRDINVDNVAVLDEVLRLLEQMRTAS